MSCPLLDCDSDAPVSSSLLAWVVMKSIWTSTFSLAPHSLISASVVSLALGTQWSQKPTDSLPAAYAPRTNGAATPSAAPPTTRPRRDSLLDRSMTSSSVKRRWRTQLPTTELYCEWRHVSRCALAAPDVQGLCCAQSIRR